MNLIEEKLDIKLKKILEMGNRSFRCSLLWRKSCKITNRNEFLEKGKGQYIDVPSKLYLTDPPSQAVEGVVGGLMGAVVVPVKVVLAIPALVVLPFLIPFMK